ncbi:DUF664 domain-containing protein [Streptomyces sp. NPDC127117]|uniref:mycothiol transferase n=1 Tax=Streptomyces sp. NPDC127117 TaxID=3345368 RepID=UPI00362FE1B5
MATSSRCSRRIDTPPPRTGNTETEVLRGFLVHLRDSIATKVVGAPELQVRTAVVPSGTNLLGLLNHPTCVERATFFGTRINDWPATFHASLSGNSTDVVARYRESGRRGERGARSVRRLRHSAPQLPAGKADARWALTHMIEETGRHAGHVHILHELIDGSTGRRLS